MNQHRCKGRRRSEFRSKRLAAVVLLATFSYVLLAGIGLASSSASPTRSAKHVAVRIVRHGSELLIVRRSTRRREARAASIVVGACKLTAWSPWSPWSGTMEGGASMGCYGNTSGVSAIYAGVCLDWWGPAWTGGPYVWNQQTCGSSYSDRADGLGLSIPLYHGCTSGYYHYWRSRANGQMVYNGTTYQFGETDQQANVRCA